MYQPLIVTVDSSKGIAKMSGPLTLGNSYKVGYAGLTEAEARETEKDPETGEVTYQGPQVVLLGIPQLTEEWETANPETRIAAMTDDNDVLAMDTQELVEAFKAAPPAPMPPVPPRDPRRPAHPMGVTLHGTARPHGAIRLHFYVTAGGETLAQGDCTLNWAPFAFDGAGTPVVLQGPPGPKGEQGEQGPQGERGADAIIATALGCVTFAVDNDESSDTYGHLFAYADNDYELYHGGDTTKPHFILGTGTGEGKNGYTAGHLFYIYYPADPSTAPSSIDLGDVRGPQGPTDSGAVFAATLKSELEQNAGEMAAWNLNTAIRLANAIKNAIFAATGQVTALLLAFVLPFFLGGTAEAGTAATIGDMDPTNTVYTSQQVDTLLEDVGHGDGTLESIWGPESFSNQTSYATKQGAVSLGIKPAESNANIRVQFDPETSTYSLQAIGGVPGPQGADGIGNVLWAGEFRHGMYITNANTWVSYDGSIWTRAPSADPIMDPPTNNLTWTRVVSRGNDGTSGRDGHDAVGLQFVEWSTNLTVLTTNMLISHAGYLLMITNKVDIANPGWPVVDGLPVPPYKAVVHPGADGGEAVVYTNASFIIDFDLQTPVGSNSLVVYKDYLWYARQNYLPNETPPPTSGPYWMCLGKQGERGPEGANGIGNLRYMGAWNQYRTNDVNDVVRWTRADGKVDWYRATEVNAGVRPDTGTNFWSKEITSGEDANTIEWKFVDGPYVDSVQHSNELHRMPDGKVWYSVGIVETGPGNSPGRNPDAWKLFVKDGTSVASNIVWRGVWSQGVSYDTGDMVTWENGGGRGLYIKKTADTNTTAPSNIDHWEAVATGIQGKSGPAGQDGTATYIHVTNIVTYSNATIITNTYNVTNDNTTAILDYNVPGEVYNTAKFLDTHFYHNPSTGVFSLTEEALGVGSFNGLRGGVTLTAGTNISFSTNNATKTITINAIVPVSGGVETLNNISGAVTLQGGGDVTITPSGSTITISATTGGGGWGAESQAIYLTSSWAMPQNANTYGAIGANTSGGDITISLAAQTNYQSIVITKLSDLHKLDVVWRTTNSLTANGEWMAFDFWPDLTNWYWRK